ncbi:HET-domain-containing protein [Hyaloscypha bicolor E]|uniref:HET-domain-containing protein n=1 Tax=Hyaloscypha bicolor E TaxID=1095630 RepID=A0A2J6SJJ4_9HELO|nr:HET-domain-containing protein [Hyaloscypha bicolor E]PMD50910.1 HET-domain-containing protein [Hyaloscypha bicolor E]
MSELVVCRSCWVRLASASRPQQSEELPTGICAASKPASTWYPTQLIDVGLLDADAENRPRLVITSEASMDGRGPYVSLSHCWGRVKPLTLTTGTLDQFLNGIDLTLVPATFLDAFKLTRAIGFRFIWIDSLCIIQNSLDDWEYEAGTMLRVYQNAYCNIAATHSRNSSQGLFRSRNPKALFVVLYLTKIQDLNGTFELPNNDQWETDIDDAPLNRRPWVVQERQISKRILHFAADQIYWDCYQSHIGEAFSHPPSSRRLATKKNQGPLDMLNEEKFSHTWGHTVHQYTSSGLTFPEKDKILAISSMAQYLQEVWSDEYCAGLWRKYIEKQLCWRSLRQPERNSPKVLRAPRGLVSLMMVQCSSTIFLVGLKRDCSYLSSMLRYSRT